jgi:hypothetical protein
MGPVPPFRRRSSQDTPPDGGQPSGNDPGGRPGRRSQLLAWTMVAIVVVVSAAVVIWSRPATSKSTAVPATSAPTPTTRVTPQLKPVLGGLLDRRKLPPEQFQGAVAGFVVPVDWAQLQPTAGGPLASGNAIDKAIASARGRHLAIKLRVLAGTSAPDWAKRLGGSPVSVTDAYGHTGTIGRFWTADFGRAYLDLQHKLAARYDGAPEVAVTQITRCTTFFAEPFLRQGRSPSTIRNLVRAGYTVAADQACQREQVDQHAVWTRTRSGLSFNPYQRVTSGGDVSPDEAFTEQMMRYCRSKLGAACVLENHSIRTTGQGKLYAQMYQAMRALGGAISFQTAAPSRIGSLLGTIDWAISQRASSVELPVSYRDSSPSSLRPRNQRLQAIAQSLR